MSNDGGSRCLRGLAQRHDVGALAEALQRPLLDLPRALSRHAELAPGLAERLRLLIARAEAHLDDVALLLRELGDCAQKRLRAQLLADLLVDWGRLDREQVAERRVTVVADRLVETDHGTVRLADLDHVLEREVRRVGDLLVSRLVTELGRELTLDAPDLPGALGHVNGEPDRPARVLEAALNGLADPERRVSREPEPLAPVELLHGPDEAEHALLDEVAEREALALVAARVGDDQTQVRVDHAVLGSEIALLDALGQLDLLARLEQRVATRLTQKQLERVQSRIRLVLEVGPGTRDIGERARFRSFQCCGSHEEKPTLQVGIIVEFSCRRNHPTGIARQSRRHILWRLVWVGP